MIDIGTTATLKIMKLGGGGADLDGENLGEVFVPGRELPPNVAEGDMLTVFLYRDSETVITGSTVRPKAQLGECAFMKVVARTSFGAFVDWGLPKDLFVPSGEQYNPLEEGRSYVILVYLDERTGRLAGTAKLHSHLSEDGTGFRPGQEVDLLISGFSDLGYKAVINNTHLGLIFKDDAPVALRAGESMKGYIKEVREDAKINLALLPPGFSGTDLLAERILAHLAASGGTSDLTDKSPAERIAATYGSSKSSYKKALGRLYKQRKIRIDKERIVLL
jgi:uncharacterized protein